MAVPTSALAAPDKRPCPVALKALDRTYIAASAVESRDANVVTKLMPAALAAEQAAGEAQLVDWPGTVVNAFAAIASEARTLAANPSARTPAAAQTLRVHAETGEAGIGTICKS